VLVTIQRTKAVALLLMVDAMFVVLHLFTRVATWNGEPIVKRHEFLDMDAETSFPTWWQETQLLLASVLCLILGSDQGPLRRYWLGLAGIFVYLSADEGSQLHEGLINPMQELFDISGGALHFAWVIPGAGAVLVFLAVYVRFWWRLPAAPRRWTAIAGVCFLLGAIGGEMLTGAYKTERGVDRGFAALNALEEGFEVLGASLFIFSLLWLLQLRQGPGAIVRVEGERAAPDLEPAP
jgi:hypothetical protein